eukprot:gnl/TRDRNA2_/TRDRNA2_68177_c0_seq2.p1 gnl/TRDRNA2_/TRDRNA2_68177_c0~~gnl/TRDRNA2_/TRDRNA2_68177_c0_seq2.p1  ORF type:complete len:156 (+),score=14.36 gnl/TRDRNA2_/TRDRNA2_68177_c0_seq2:286-753(+)
MCHYDPKLNFFAVCVTMTPTFVDIMQQQDVVAGERWCIGGLTYLYSISRFAEFVEDEVTLHCEATNGLLYAAYNPLKYKDSDQLYEITVAIQKILQICGKIAGPRKTTSEVESIGIPINRPSRYLMPVLFACMLAGMLGIARAASNRRKGPALLG